MQVIVPKIFSKTIIFCELPIALQKNPFYIQIPILNFWSVAIAKNSIEHVL